MNSMDVEVLRTATRWLDAGRRVTMGTVVHTWGSSPRPPGSLMIIRDDGQVAGSLSGGCIEDDLVDRVRRGEFDRELPYATVYGANAEESRRFGLPCGGSVQLVLEQLGAHSMIAPLLCDIERHRVVHRTLRMVDGVVRLQDGRHHDRVVFDGRTLQTVHGPSLRLLIIGAGQLSSYLAAMARMLDYQVVVCEPRVEYLESWPAEFAGELSREMPDDLVVASTLDARCAVVAVTHDPKLDDLALMEALKTPAFYVAALGSRHNNATRRERLREFDVSAEQVARLRGPAGLNLGGKTPPEIALAIMAEMTALHRGMTLDGTLTDWSGSTSVCGLAN